MALSQEAMAANRAATDLGYTPVESERAPIRVIRDNFPTYSAIAVDLNSNEVYLQDENLFGYKVFDRLTDTPPTAAFSEPKRMVGGLQTKLEFNCGLYVDPVTGDVYSVNNDTVNTMVIFAREAEGNVPPKRELSTPHRTYGIMADEEAQELYLTVEDPPQVVVYRKQAEGDEEPLRVLEGPSTQLEDAHGIALDKRNGWMFVSNHGSSSDASGVGHFAPPSITVYPLKASGDTAPIRIIEGSRTQLNWPAAMTLNEQTGELYVANDADSSILVFKVTDRGNAAPTRMIKGPKTGIRHPTGIFLDLKNKEIWVSNMGNHSATVYALDAEGDTAPLRTIRSAPQGKLAQAIGNPGAVGYDSKREEILVPN
jgi:DNA-binding beta-propeller fold protein YncE